MTIDIANLPPHQKMIRQLSDRIVAAQRPIRILDALKWHPHIKEEFFHNKFKKLPNVDASYYTQNNPLPFNIFLSCLRYSNLSSKVKWQKTPNE